MSKSLVSFLGLCLFVFLFNSLWGLAELNKFLDLHEKTGFQIFTFSLMKFSSCLFALLSLVLLISLSFESRKNEVLLYFVKKNSNFLTFAGDCCASTREELKEVGKKIHLDESGKLVGPVKVHEELRKDLEQAEMNLPVLEELLFPKLRPNDEPEVQESSN